MKGPIRAMPVINTIASLHDEMTAWRRDFHMHPEIGFEEVRTSQVVAERLQSWGIEVHREIGKTGVVGVLHGKNGASGKSVGLRADMDALPILEANEDKAYRSTKPGTMHACGHDGHTTMLLGAAKYLAESRNFDGTVYFIFQPAEEGLGGGLAMCDAGLFEKFPADRVFAVHNAPHLPLGSVGWCAGRAMAAGDRFEIWVKGKGSHGAFPHAGIDPVFIGCQIVGALQGLVSRNTDPLEAAVLSVGEIRGGNAFNVVPDEVYLCGTTRMFDPGIRDRMESQIEAVADGIARAQGAKVAYKYTRVFPTLVNDAAETDFGRKVAEEVVGADKVAEKGPTTGAEDFAFMLEQRPGAYLWLGQAQDGHNAAPVHNPHYDFNDNLLPIGATWFSRVVETALPG